MTNCFVCGLLRKLKSLPVHDWTVSELPLLTVGKTVQAAHTTRTGYSFQRWKPDRRFWAYQPLSQGTGLCWHTLSKTLSGGGCELTSTAEVNTVVWPSLSLTASPAEKISGVPEEQTSSVISGLRPEHFLPSALWWSGSCPTYLSHTKWHCTQLFLPFFPGFLTFLSQKAQRNRPLLYKHFLHSGYITLVKSRSKRDFCLARNTACYLCLDWWGHNSK